MLKPKPSAKRDQKRGQERRQHILATTRILLESNELEALSLADIAKHTDIPVSSLYHFYGNMIDIYKDIVEQFRHELLFYLNAQWQQKSFTQWHQMIDWLVECSAAFYHDHYAFQQLILSGKAPAQIKQQDRANDNELAQALSALFGQHFELPSIPNLEEIVFNAVQIVDLFFSIAITKENTLDPRGIEESKRASKAYLRSYFPEYLHTTESIRSP